MQKLVIKKDGNLEHILIDGNEVENVVAYELKNSANKAAELTLKICVTVDQVEL